MTAFLIGDWVRRKRRGVPHLVESIVAGDAVTKCGRRMRDEPNGDGPLLVGGFRRKCRQCAPEARSDETNGYGQPQDEVG